SFLSLTSGQSSIVRSRRRAKGGQKTEKLDRRHGKGRQHDNPSPSSVRHREVSTSTGRRTSFLSATRHDDEIRYPTHSSVAFSSSYFPPYFPLQAVRPGVREAWIPVAEHGENDPFHHCAFTLEDVDPEGLDEDCLYTSIIAEFPSGVSLFAN